jgi:histidinol-phosphatase (PHP family)
MGNNSVLKSKMIYRTDYHIHTLYSDGRATPDDYIPPALTAGINEIGFSEHLTLFQEQQYWNMNPDNISNYLHHIDSLRRNNTEINIKTGLEVDFFEGKEKETEAFLKSIELDYVIGSVHYLGEKTVDEGPEFYIGKNFDRLFESYFDHIYKAVSSGLFDIIAHCDLIRIYGYKPSFDPEPLYRKVAKAMRDSNVTFEINTNGRNRPLADFYPDRKFLYVFREEKVSVCVNSDAHMPIRVGQYFDEAYDLLRSIGFNDMAVYDKRKRQLIPF